MSGHVTHALLVECLARLDATFAKPGRLFLIGETTHVFEGWRTWTTQIEIASDVARKDRHAFDNAIDALRTELDVPIYDESPGEVIPLPSGNEGRARRALQDNVTHLEIFHFDPYSVSFRFISRGDEPDYHTVLAYIEHGWITWQEMDERLQALLPQFTAETIQQDPAEFRRKYKGLLQMSRAVRSGTTHRSTAA